MKINIAQLIKWVVDTLEFKEFFGFMEIQAENAAAYMENV